MTTDTSKVTVHMVASLDGFIAKSDGGIAWLQSSDSYEKGDVGENADDFVKSIGCYVMGSRTYEHALTLSRKFGWAYGDVPTFVLTRRHLPAERQSVEFYSGDLHALVNERLRPRYKNIWVVGGAAVVKDFIRLKLANDIRLAVMPILLGDDGTTLFFDHVGEEQRLHLKDVTAYKDGMVELWYEIKTA